MSRVVILTVGDLGRSPRMQYHALALAGQGHHVDLVGLDGADTIDALAAAANVTCHRIADPPATGGTVSRIRRSLARLLRFWRWIGSQPQPADIVLVQTPPAFPALPLARAAATRYRAKLIIDWHNFASSMIALDLGATHPLVRLTDQLEKRLGRTADACFCVSRAMAAKLEGSFTKSSPTVLYDRPAIARPRLPDAERAALLERLQIDAAQAVFVTSTSWSRDEDFSLLLDAATALDRKLAGSGRRPTIVASGKGPGRADFERRARALGLQNVHLRTLWLSWNDYPALLASADLGICLHTSSSGLDLPMKILDMFGCGLPVCAYDYGPTLRELVRENENGFFFRSADELAALLASAGGHRGNKRPRQVDMAAALTEESALDWITNWQSVAAAFFTDSGSSPRA